ncbi:MAG: mechanosensitive ion channel domain-containing protein [Steroidobacteraceae bacterium]
MRVKLTLLALLGTASAHVAAAAAEPQKPVVPDRPRAAVMTGEQVVQILDETVDWYRTLGTQQQTATQPSDLLIVYANRQTADKVMALAFEIARANAELLSSEASAARTAEEGAPSLQALVELKKKLDDQRVSLQGDLESVRQQIAAATGTNKAELQTKLAVLQSEYDLVKARINLRDTMAQFTSENDAKGFDANALKTHIDAIAASIPSASAVTAPAGTVAATADAGPVRELLPAVSNPSSQLAIWSSAATVLRLSAKIRTIDAIDQRTESLQQVFTEIRTAPLDQLKMLAARGDALAAQSDTANSETLKGMRDQFDTLAWLFKQTSSILTPLSKEGVLLKQYRHNLANWRDATRKQYHDALKALGMRIAIVAGLLAIVFGAAELWRRAVYRYVAEARRQYRLLLVRKIIFWCLVVAIVGATFATELGSLVTFAGLITAGLAVAMQSVLVSVVGYFFLIGKYGIRVGDRVQIGNVTGEVIELGLVRLHLMELSGQGPLGPTGRVVAFANSIIFQASGGLFKQIPGVNLAWHDITLKLPAGVNYAKVKDQLAEAVVDVIEDYREDIVRQTREIQKTALSSSSGDARPQVQLRFSADGVEASVRYPVQLQHAAEIDERVSQALLNVVSSLETQTPRLG